MKHLAPVHSPFATLSQNCANCRHPLLEDDPKTAEFCSRPACVTQRRMQSAAKLAMQREKEKAEEAAIAQHRVQPVLDEITRKLSPGAPDIIPSGLSPYIDVPCETLPDAQRTEFADHVKSIVRESFAETPDDQPPPPPPKGDPDYARRLKEEAPEPRVLDTACIACQGHCCLQGRGTHAFLTRKTIDYVRWRSPELSADDIIDMYLSTIPEKSIRGSCVYHGPQGCVQRRDVRADICNSFQCRYRLELRAAHDEAPNNGAVIAGLALDHQDHPEDGAPFLRVVSMSPSGAFTVHDDVTLPALPKQVAQDD